MDSQELEECSKGEGEEVYLKVVGVANCEECSKGEGEEVCLKVVVVDFEELLKVVEVEVYQKAVVNYASESEEGVVN